MQLLKLLSAVPGLAGLPLKSTEDPEVSGLACDSRGVSPGGLFFAIQGGNFDGNAFVPDALSRGAVAVLSEMPRPDSCPVPWIQVLRIRRVMAQVADRFFGYPSSRLRLAGITGTNGKTTTAYIVHRVLDLAGGAVMIGTVQTRIRSRSMPALLTTPESIEIQATLSQALDEDCRYGVMEVSSHALFQQRTFGCRFPVSVFTNLTQDHLDFHKTLDNYFQAKSLLFSPDYNPGLESAVINGDDPRGRALADRIPGALTYGLEPDNDIYPCLKSTGLDGTRLDVSMMGRRLRLESALSGTHNCYNLLAAATACFCLGVPEQAIEQGIRDATTVPGRFERVPLDRPYSVFIDYAHSPDALENVLRLARGVTQGRLICLFGCGGDRDRTKRPRMGSIAARLADLVIVTSDNPRTEDPGSIVQEILAGIPPGSGHVEAIVDRRQAIRHALEIAREDDLVLLAGKGHETYQDIGGRRNPFDERQVVREELCCQ